jgi:acyl-[acyl-carrier-protein]-phospholipid O-acyltransferase/long-chain-fatty-acid--[acyl-carrier-protein] ligase
MLDDWILRPVFTALLKLLFGVRVTGREHYPHTARGLIVICNHQSFLDPLLLAVLLPRKPAFAMNVYQAEKWYFRILMALVKVYVLDPMKPMSMKSLIKDVEAGEHVVFFPEGRITTSGGIMKIYEGVSLIIEKTGATVLPVTIDGAQYSKLSFLKGKVKQRWFPRIRMRIFLPQALQDGQFSPRKIYDLMTATKFESSPYRQSLLAAMLASIARNGGGHIVANDINRQPLNYRQLFTKAFVLSNVILRRGGAESAGSPAQDPAQSLRASQDDEKHIAVLLPNSLGVMVTFVALHMLGKIPCMLNFSSGNANMLHACRIANVNTVLTSRAFIEKAELQDTANALAAEHTLIYLEDVRSQITLTDKLKALFYAYFPRLKLGRVLWQSSPDDPAVILYTSGSEGVPKGVALSHANILSNIYQALARVDLNHSDHIFNAMPVFHSFGLTIGMLLPLVHGVKTFLYPTPLHYRIIPELVYDTDATVMLGTDTFLRGYARYAHPYDFWRVRFLVAGAEKLKESTRGEWTDRFNVNIFEGYGVTETSPVLAVNTPMQHKAGTVGRPLPGIECRLMKVEGIERGGRLEVRGPNVMLGYLKADQPGVIQHQGEWYDTGDIVDIDEEGFITILGRAKRFAKIAGEMVSLQSVEDIASAVQPEFTHAAISVPDDRKGEQIILYTESKTLTREQLQQQLKTQGGQELLLPKQVAFMESIPKLGNGKIDYMALKK